MTHIHGDRPQEVHGVGDVSLRRLSGAQPEILTPPKTLPEKLPAINDAPKHAAVASGEKPVASLGLGVASQVEEAPYRNMFAGYEKAGKEGRMEILRAFVADCRKGANTEKTDDELFRHYDELNEMRELVGQDPASAKALLEELKLVRERMQETTRETGKPLKDGPLHREFAKIQELIDNIS